MARWRWFVTLVLAGCAATPQSTAPGTPGAVDAVPNPVSAAPHATSPTPTPLPLESVLPQELGGVELHTFAVGQDIVERLGAQLEIGSEQLEVQYASEHGARFLQMYALRAPGTSGPQLVEAWTVVAYPADVQDATSNEETFDGKTITVVHSPSAAARLGSFYVSSSDGTLLVVQAIDPEVAAEALAALP